MNEPLFESTYTSFRLQDCESFRVREYFYDNLTFSVLSDGEQASYTISFDEAKKLHSAIGEWINKIESK